MSNPANPTRLGGCSLQSYAYHVCLSGTRLFVATASGLKIVDVSDVTNPHTVGSFTTSDDCTGIDVYGNVAYLSGFDGLQLLDISDPALPKHLSTYSGGGPAKAVCLFGHYAYVRTSSAIDVVDISMISLPRRTARLDADSSTPSGVQVYDGKLFATFVGKRAGLYIIGLEEPATPTNLLGAAFTGSVIPFGNATGSHPSSLSVSERLAFMTTRELKVMVFSVTNVAQPALLAEYDAFPSSALLNDSLKDISTSGGQVYVPAGALGVQILEFSGNTFTRRGALETAWDFRGIAVARNLAFVVDYVNGFHVIDVADVSRPSRVGLLPMDFDGNRITMLGDMALVANGTNGISYIDVSVPGKPELLSPVTFGTVPVRDVQISGSQAYVACDSAGLVILTMTNATSPALLGVYNTPGTAGRLTADSDLAFVADGDGGLQIISVSNPTLPGRLKELPVGNVLGIAVARNIAYLAINGWAIGAYDVSNAAAPQFVQSFTAFSGGVLNEVLALDRRVLGVFDKGVAVFSVTNSAPVEIFNGSGCKTACLSNGAIYVGGDFGLKILAGTTSLVSPLRVSRISPEVISLSWTGSGTLESAPTVAGPWTEIPGAQSPQQIHVSQKQAFFRLK